MVVAETPCMCSLYLHLHNPRQGIYSVPWVIIGTSTSTGTRTNRDLDLEYCLRERMTRLNNVHCTAVHLSFRVPSASELQLFFRSGSGYFKDKDKLLSLSLPPCRSYLFSLEHIQSFPPSLPPSLFVSSEKLFNDKKGALHSLRVFRRDWEGRERKVKSY